MAPPSLRRVPSSPVPTAYSASSIFMLNASALFDISFAIVYCSWHNCLKINI
ncbi:hypothetical protein Mpsy_2547 [Methanolobus psychrophilus R15]|nr:hypothetical protein Mpsy_2547 [Methanolobus psychrophilus R15]